MFFAHWRGNREDHRHAADLRNRSEEHTSELQSQSNLVCRLLLEKKKTIHSPSSVSRLSSTWPRTTVSPIRSDPSSGPPSPTIMRTDLISPPPYAPIQPTLPPLDP